MKKGRRRLRLQVIFDGWGTSTPEWAGGLPMGRAPHSVRLAINAQVATGCFEAAVDKLRDLLGNPEDDLTV